MLFQLAMLVGCSQAKVLVEETTEKQTERLKIWPKLDFEVKRDQIIESKVINLLSSMTLEQKVAQMIQPEIRDISLDDMHKYGFGSYLNGASGFPNNNKHSTPQDWVDFAEQMYQASIDDSLDGIAIPTMWGTDAVHGHNNIIGATLFPHNIGLGAANNLDLIEKIAQVTATEVMVTGIDWVFAPTVAAVRDDRWGRTYEGYSEDPEIIKTYAAAMVKGLQGRADLDFLAEGRVISTVKHFIGDGGTEEGDDQGNNIADEQTLFDVHAQGYVGGLTAGAQSVMASFNSWHGEKSHGSRYLLTEVLKQNMGFDGFVVGDWNGHGQIEGCSNDSCPQAVNAGLDVFMVPTSAWKPLLENTINQVKQGLIPIARIDDAVSRILRVKYRAGLFDKSSPANRSFSGKTELIGSESHRAIARQAVRESLVLLKNNEGLLPLSPKMNILVAGDGANNIGKQSGGWTVSWQGTDNNNSDFPGGSSIYDGLEQQVKAAGGQIELNEKGEFTHKPDVAVVVFGEDPYAEGHGDVPDLAYQKGEQSDLALLKRLKQQGIPVVSIFLSGRPMWVNAELNASDAFVAAWLPGSEGKAVADVLLADIDNKVQYDFKGKLSFSWPNSPIQVVNRFDDSYQPLFPYGFGLHYGELSHLPSNLPEIFVSDSLNNKSIPLFTGIVNKRWSMVLTSAQEEVVIDSSSKSLEGINYRTVDKDVQEDAFRLISEGKASAGLKFVSVNDSEVGLNAELTNASGVSITVKRDSDISQPVWVFIKCAAADISDETTTSNCYARFDIANNLAQLPVGQWQQLSIDLSCFTKYETQQNTRLVPFELHSAGAINLSISNIHFNKNTLEYDGQCYPENIQDVQ